jgi:1-acyl-sn-glycerol-3-phosphate acyltransferase
MIYPGNNKLIGGFFGWYISRSIKRHFYRVNFNKVTLHPGKATLLVANHYSWWDGFIFYHLNKVLFRKKLHVMVLEETLKNWPFMRYLGAFSIKKGAKDMSASLSYAADILEQPGNLLLLFPQGKLYSNFIADIHFQKGLDVILEKASAGFQCLLAAGFTENFAQKKPSVSVYLKVLNGPDITRAAVSQAYQEHYNESKKRQTLIIV